MIDENNNKDPLLQFKQDTDESLFSGVQFDERMKSAVLSQIRLDQDVRHRKARRRRLWIAPLTAAAVMALVIVASLQLQLFPGEGEGVGTDPNIMVMPGDILQAPPETDPHSSLFTEWLLSDLQEAGEWFGEQMVIPGYVPAGYEAGTIHASGQMNGEAIQLILTYSSGELSYRVSQRKQWFEEDYGSLPSVQLGDATVYYIEAEQGIGGSELHWHRNNVQYSIIGMISHEEALEIAQSML